MFEIMKSYGHEFKPAWWRDLIQITFRIFDVIRVPHTVLVNDTAQTHSQTEVSARGTSL
jgi:hypothetical protein